MAKYNLPEELRKEIVDEVKYYFASINLITATNL